KALYIKTIEDILKDRVPYWCAQVGVAVPAFGVNRAKGKWGVCYPLEKRLYLSYMCATLPRNLIDMTVLHEVCHLRYSGHGKRFWALMHKHMPDLDERKAGLSALVRSGWSMNIV
ncbi:MAG: M48 family metallopeptidase, partial [Spirochaetales bacterium]|nr:M48 family metallopeptidase [Spirochaetales bacterium]